MVNPVSSQNNMQGAIGANSGTGSTQALQKDIEALAKALNDNDTDSGGGAGAQQALAALRKDLAPFLDNSSGAAAKAGGNAMQPLQKDLDALAKALNGGGSAADARQALAALKNDLSSVKGGLPHRHHHHRGGGNAASSAQEQNVSSSGTTALSGDNGGTINVKA